MKEKYISRVDSEKSKMYGYLLRLYKDRGVLYQEWFSDKVYGGKDKSLRAALETRDRKIKELNYNPRDGLNNRPWRPIQFNKKPKSNTGHLGIYESHEFKTLKNGKQKKCTYIAVSYVEKKGRSRIKKFYIGKKRNRDEALEEAIQFRTAREFSVRAAAVEYNRDLQKRMIAAENKARNSRPVVTKKK